MNKKSPLQSAMFAEMQDKKLFKKAQQYGFEYLDEVFDRNVFPTPKAMGDLAEFEEALQEENGDSQQIIEQLNQFGAKTTLPSVGGRYFGFVNGSVVPTGLAAKNLAIYWDQNAAMHIMSPIANKLGAVVQEWLIDLFGFPKETVTGYVSGTSMANLAGLLAGRYRLLKNQRWDVSEQGLFGAPKIRVVTGAEIHSSIKKAIALTGFGKGNIEWVECDEQGTIIPEKIPELDNSTLLILQAGNVNSGGFDNFKKVVKKAREAGAWIHIDGAFGLWAGATQRLKHLTEGFEYAHSWAVDGHKTLNTPYDSGIIFCQDEEALVSALHSQGSYLILSKTERDGMLYTPEMSKRARVIELWATLKYLGKAGIDEMIWEMHKRSKQFADLLSKTNGFRVLNRIDFNQTVVCCETDELTDAVLEKIQELSVCWVGGSTWKGRKVIRISVCSWATTEVDVERSVASFEKAYLLVKNK